VTDATRSVVAVRDLHWLKQHIAPLQGPLVVALTYYLGAQAAFLIGTLSDQIFALFWPPNVILFCALLFVSQRRWWLYIIAVFPAHVIAEHGVGMPVPQMLVAFVTNCMVALLNAYAVRRFVGDPPWFGSFQKATNYIVITAGLSPGLSAFGGAFVPILGGGGLENYWAFYAHWYLANALPNLTLGPVLLIWLSDEPRWTDWIPSRRHVEPLLMTVVLAATCVAVTHFAGGFVHSRFLPALLLLPLPVVLWAAVRFGEKGASGAILIVAVFMTWAALRGTGVLANDDPENSVLAAQIFLLGVSIPLLLLGAMIDELRRAERAMRQLAASILRVQDDERRRIARDLHDSTGQNLIAASLIAGEMQKLMPAAGEPLVRKLDDMLQTSIREIRTVSYLLHPPLLDEAGLGLAVREYVQGYVERSGIKVDLQIASDLDRLSGEVELVLFRVVQEALANVARHSKSATARIELKRVKHSDREYVTLSIEDAGKGMGAAARRGAFLRRQDGAGHARGVGLASMSERVRQVGGRIEIDSTVGRTIVAAVIPLNQ
jgi:signal transduction histidine kinase